MIAQDVGQRPNVILFGIGHSGTSIVTRMLHTLGWQKGDADEEYSESVATRQVNKKALHGNFDADEARERLAQLAQPWALKDPRFVHTINNWLPLMADYEPMLIRLVRDSNAVEESYRRRGEETRFGHSIGELHDLASMVFASWPWRKVRVEYENLREAVGLFDVQRMAKVAT